jgi:hypothetical protein
VEKQEKCVFVFQTVCFCESVGTITFSRNSDTNTLLFKWLFLNYYNTMNVPYVSKALRSIKFKFQRNWAYLMRQLVSCCLKSSLFFLICRMGWDRVHLVRWPLFSVLYQPRMMRDRHGVVGGMRIYRGNRSTRRKPTLVPLCAPQIPHDLT